MEVDAAGISVKVGAHYPGRSVHLLGELPLSRGEGMDGQKSAEGIVGDSISAEGPNTSSEVGSLSFDGDGEAEQYG
jgi:hypothetical protein